LIDGGIFYQMMKGQINMNFPCDPDTLGIIKEMEVYLEIPHKNITEINNWELHNYINMLTLLFIKGGDRNSNVKR